MDMRMSEFVVFVSPSGLLLCGKGKCGCYSEFDKCPSLGSDGQCLKAVVEKERGSKEADKDALIDILKAELAAARELRSVSDHCTRTHEQYCNICDNAECGDNTNPTIVALRSSLETAQKAVEITAPGCAALLRRAEEAEASAMALVLNHEGHIKKLDEEIERLRSVFGSLRDAWLQTWKERGPHGTKEVTPGFVEFLDKVDLAIKTAILKDGTPVCDSQGEVNPEWSFTETLDLESRKSNPRALEALRGRERVERARDVLRTYDSRECDSANVDFHEWLARKVLAAADGSSPYDNSSAAEKVEKVLLDYCFPKFMRGPGQEWDFKELARQIISVMREG